VPITGTPGGPGIFQFPSASGEMWQGVNPPVEESDLRKMSAEEMKKRLVSMEVKVIESGEGNAGTPLAGSKRALALYPGLPAGNPGGRDGVAGRV